MESYSGKQKIEFCKRLGKNWQDLADYFDIPVSAKPVCTGKEAREIWTWLEQQKNWTNWLKPLILLTGKILC